jgi:hypothetical protein
MSAHLDELIAAAAPITDAELQALPVEEIEAQLCAMIMSEPRVPEPGRARRSASARLARLRAATHRRVPARAFAFAALVAALVAGGVVLPGTGMFGRDSRNAFAASAVQVANAVPRLLIGEPGWTVQSANDFRVASGEMTFAKGDGSIGLYWRPAADHAHFVRDRAAGADHTTLDVLGRRVDVFASDGPSRPFRMRHFTALWLQQGYSMEFRSEAVSRTEPGQTVADFERVLRSLRMVTVDAWLSAMPSSVVRPADHDKAVAAILADIPLPPDFDFRALESRTAVKDHNQLVIEATGAAACSWVERWVAARRTNDEATAAAAVSAMATSRRWPALRRMPEGGFQEMIWQFADAMATGTMAPNGRVTVDEIYRSAVSALSCDGTP